MPGGRFENVAEPALRREQVEMLDQGQIPPGFGSLLLKALPTPRQKESFPSGASKDAPLGLFRRILPSPGAVTQIAVVCDDGFLSNLDAAAVLHRYGFAATMAIEIEKIHTNYGGNEALPICKAADLRKLIEVYGWEICNHPNLSLAGSEADMVEAAEAEHTQLRNVLSGALVYRNGQWISGPVTHPEYLDYPIQASVYRGGTRDATSDSAYEYLYDKIRTIPGTVESRGNRLHFTDNDGEFGQHWSAYSIDTDGDETQLRQAIAHIQGASSSGLCGVIYLHKTPATSSSPDAISPYVDLIHLEKICKAAAEAGVVLCPLRDLGASNLCLDPRFEDASTHTFVAASGDTAEYSTEEKLHSGERSVKLSWSTYRGNLASTSFRTELFACRPFTRYKVKIRYKINEELVLSGGTGNHNHGLALAMTTYQANTALEENGTVDDFNHYRNFTTWGTWWRPYEDTEGEWATKEVELYTGWGYQAALRIGGLNCTGTVYIGHISITRGESLRRSPLRGTNTHNAGGARNLYLMRPSSSAAARKWEWEVRLLHEPNYVQAGIVTVTLSSNYTQAAITNTGGMRVDAFTWVAEPLWVD